MCSQIGGTTPTTNQKNTTMKNLIQLPRKFYDDHAERDLPTPVAVRKNSKSVWVDGADENLPELIEDAYYYANKDIRDGFASDCRHWCYAAERLLAAYHKQIWK
jgi:hypothetical protein